MKAEESAHNEILAYLTIILGSIFLVAGFLENIIIAESPQWFLMLPYQQLSHPSSVLGLILTVLGFVLISAGFILSVYYDRKKTRYLNQLDEASVLWKQQEKSRRK
jgi:uncharacterized membrane protein